MFKSACVAFYYIILTTPTLKIWEKVVDEMMIQCTNSQFGFLPDMSTTEAIFTPKQTIEKHIEGQTNIRGTFLDLEKIIRPHT